MAMLTQLFLLILCVVIETVRPILTTRTYYYYLIPYLSLTLLISYQAAGLALQLFQNYKMLQEKQF